MDSPVNDLLTLAYSGELPAGDEEHPPVIDLDSLLLEVFRLYKGAQEKSVSRLTLQHLTPARVSAREGQLKPGNALK
jgi:hypothetical protein